MDCRCKSCKHLLGTDLNGKITIKCSKCKTFNIFDSIKENQTGNDQQSFTQNDEKTLAGYSNTDQ